MDCSQELSTLLKEVSDLPEQLVLCIKHGTNDGVVTALSLAALDPQLTTRVFTPLPSLALELCMRWKDQNHSAVVAAFGRVLDLFPHLTEAALRVLSDGSGELHLLHGLDALDASGDLDAVINLLLGTLRLLRYDNDTFTCLRRPTDFLKYFEHRHDVVRYLAIRIFCVEMYASDKMQQSLFEKHLRGERINGPYEGVDIDYTFFALWERKRIEDGLASTEKVRSKFERKELPTICHRQLEQQNFSGEVVLVEGTLLLKSSQSSPITSSGLTIFTPTTSYNLSQLAQALNQPGPILVTGLPGSGKTHAIDSLAAQLHRSSKMITLHLNEQSDMKLLVGVYTTGSQPGSFQWNPGVLTTALREGRWVMIEDLDRIPSNAMSTLLPLIERGELSIPSRNELIKAAKGFRIIATMRSFVNTSGDEASSLSRIMGARLWRQINFKALRASDMRQIVTQQYPIIRKYLDEMLTTFTDVQEEISRLTIRHPILRARPLSIRELLKWCGRASQALRLANCVTGEEPVPETTIDSLFLDALDCFVGHVEVDEVIATVASIVAKHLRMHEQRHDHLLNNRKPAYRPGKGVTDKNFLIGRAKLAVRTANQSSPAYTKGLEMDTNVHALRLMEQVGVALSMKEPILLVGETGIGKTTVVQSLAKLLRHHLTAINLSQQSESDDLLVGFKPVNARTFMTPLKDAFDALYQDKLDNAKNTDFAKALRQNIANGQWERVLKLWGVAIRTMQKSLSSNKREAKRQKIARDSQSATRDVLNDFANRLAVVEHRLTEQRGAFAFEFVEGKLVNAVRNGHWVLLDEINLASQETLECIADLLEGGRSGQPSIMLSETGRTERIEAHPDFRLFGAMNPASDIGKRDLPMAIRSRFTEIFDNCKGGTAHTLYNRSVS